MSLWNYHPIKHGWLCDKSCIVRLEGFHHTLGRQSYELSMHTVLLECLAACFVGFYYLKRVQTD